MKIVCQSCQAKYSIADDKVQGKKVFKIKCKKCGEDILVRGAEGGEAESTGSHSAQEPFTEDEATKVVSSTEAAAAGAGGDGGWHAVVNGNQEGPFSIQQLKDMVGGGTIDGEAFVWKDGFAEWKPLKDVPELAVLVLPGGKAAAPAGGDLFAGGGGGGGGGGGLFGGEGAQARTSAKASAKGDLFAAESASGKGGMFGGGAAEEEVSTSASAGAAKPAANAMTGARNENSVLFSLASLQAIAGTTGPAKVGEPGAAGKKSDADASGIIDIKSMGASMGPGGGKSKAVDDLLTVGASSPLGSPLAAPVLAPVPTPTAASPEPERQASGGSKSGLIAGVLIAAILAAGGIGVAFLLKPNAPATVVVNAPPIPAANNNAANNAPGNNAAPGNSAAAPGTTVADNSNPAPAGADPAANRNDRTREHTRETRDTHTTTAAGAAGSTPPATTTTQPAQASNTSGCATRCHGNIDCLLRCTAGGGGGGSQPASTSQPTQSSSGGGPETPSRNDVISAMGRVRSAVVNCAGGQSGTATISITFASNGHVTSATASGAPFAGTPAGSCMARAVRSATVPPFTRPTFSVTYPFRI